LAVIDDFLNIECELVATNGPFASSPLSSEISADGANRLQPQWQNMRRGQLESPPGQLVNSGIPCDTYLESNFILRLLGPMFY